jgi:hypothetical protein
VRLETWNVAEEAATFQALRRWMMRVVGLTVGVTTFTIDLGPEVSAAACRTSVYHVSLCCYLWPPFGGVFLEAPCRAEQDVSGLMWGGD